MKGIPLQARYYGWKPDLRKTSVEITEVICFCYASTELLCCFKGAKSHLRSYLIGFPLRFESSQTWKALWFVKITWSSKTNKQEKKKVSIRFIFHISLNFIWVSQSSARIVSYPWSNQPFYCIGIKLLWSK